MARSIDFDAFCERYEAKGRAQVAIAALHDDPDLLEYLKVDGAKERWEAARQQLPTTIARIQELEAAIGEHGGASAIDVDPRLAELHRCYRTAFLAYNDKGIVEALEGSPAPSRPRSRRRGKGPKIAAPGPPRDEAETTDSPPEDERRGDPQLAATGGDGAEAPVLTVTMPVWSRTPELAEMAVRTVERVWDVARLPSEVLVIDNGSPEQRALRARVHHFEENRGVATAWNTGFELARAPVVAVLNSDCRVEPGWDEALYEAATTGRRIAFPYTDHCDGLGFRQPDQGGTAGWCFMFTQALYREIGGFDERFNPAYVEDTDYWHRAWELGIDLSPVPAARVVHARRTSSDNHSDWLLTGHRYLYGWKHGVEPMAAPPYYNREIVEYLCAQESGSRATTT